MVLKDGQITKRSVIFCVLPRPFCAKEIKRSILLIYMDISRTQSPAILDMLKKIL